MQDEGMAILKSADLWENRDKIVRLVLNDGEVLLAKVISMPCDCGQCDDNLMFYEQVWSSRPEHQEKWRRDRQNNVGGYAISLDLVQSAEWSRQAENDGQLTTDN